MTSSATSYFLIGPTGAGKTTVGRLLATSLNLTFIDLDEEIEARSGADIPWIFDVEGEIGFRDRESKALVDLVDRPGIVLSTGAGVVARPENRALLTAHKPSVIWLKVDLKTQYERLRHDKGRPLLQVNDPKAKLRAMATEREPWYAECAGVQVSTGRASPNAVVKRILAGLGVGQ